MIPRTLRNHLVGGARLNFPEFQGSILQSYLILRCNNCFYLNFNSFQKLEGFHTLPLPRCYIPGDTSSAGVAEWLRGSVSKIVGFTRVGSNPVDGITNHKLDR